MQVDALRERLYQENAYNLNIDNNVNEIGKKIEEKKSIVVIIDSKIEFDKHINQTINKANSNMTVISRYFTTLNKNYFVPLYKALVRSHLHHAAAILVRDPHCKKTSN